MIEVPARFESIVSPGRVTFWIPTTRIGALETERHNIGDHTALLRIQRFRRKRTTGPGSQNSALWGYATQIAEYTGDTSDGVMFAAKRRAMRRGYPARTDADGNMVLSLHDGGPQPESTTNINTGQAAALIDELLQIAAELGVVLRQ